MVAISILAGFHENAAHLLHGHEMCGEVLCEFLIEIRSNEIGTSCCCVSTWTFATADIAPLLLSGFALMPVIFVDVQ